MRPEASNSISRQVLEDLGLIAEQLGPESRWAAVHDGRGHGYASNQDIATLVARLDRTGSTAPVRCAVTALLGIDLLDAEVDGRRLLGLESARRIKPELRWSGKTVDYYWEDSGALWLTVPPGAFARVTWVDADLLVRDEGRVVQLVSAAHPPRVAESPEVAHWLSADAPDWLRAVVEARLASGDQYRIATAAGLALTHDDHAGSHAWLVQLLSGTPLEVRSVDAWWEHVPTTAAEWTRALAVAEALALREQVLALRADLLVDDADWSAGLLSVCHARDALEGARRLLLRRDLAATLEPVVALLDKAGLTLVADVSPSFAIADEWLWSTRTRDPAAWWASCAVAGEGFDDA